MWEQVGLRRDAQGLEAAQRRLRQVAASGLMDPETANMLLAAQAITTCALARTESRGGHYRADFPASDPRRSGRHSLATALPPAEQASEGLVHYARA
jgi:L-aspartate oxidase